MLTMAECQARVAKGMTLHPSNYMVLEAVHGFTGSRFAVTPGERRCIRYGYEDPEFVPRIVTEVRTGQSIDWGGAACMPGSYRVLFDGIGPLPTSLR